MKQNMISSDKFNSKKKKTMVPTNKPNTPKIKPLKVIPLGGMREIGKNMFVYEYGNDIIIVDCGIGFPEDDMPGIDIVIPDMTYVFKNRSRVRGVFFTHGHEDHIGAVAWLTKEVKAPLYGSKLAIALIRSKMEDRGGSLKNLDLHPVEDGDVIKAGLFSVEFIHSNHSIADANILAIRTTVGTVIHTGDFKIDFTPINGDPISLHRLAEVGREKPLLLMCESTNVEKPGFSMSESKVGDSFSGIFEKAPGRIIVATFSSNIYRMQQIFTAAERFDRKVCLIGRSVVNVFTAANSLGYMTVKPDTLIDVNRIKDLDPAKVVIISTGSQGEPLAALTKMAFSEHQKIEISSKDTVILSSSPIPGNEKSIYKVINELYLRGANVIYASLAEVHASGHAYQEELKLMHQLVQSKYFVPMHGEYRMLFQHSQLAQRMGKSLDDIFLLNNGDILEITKEKAQIKGSVPAEGIMVDGTGYAEAGNSVLKERITLSDEGIVSIAIAVDLDNDVMLGDPVVHTKGFLYESEAEEIVSECLSKVYSYVHKTENSDRSLKDALKTNKLRDQIRDYLYNKTKRRPIILLSIIDV
ncbi:MAG: ribonuclease J [Saccharofermentanales bacterium]